MGLVRDLAAGAARGVLDVLQKAGGGFPPPKDKDQDKEDGPPGKGGNDGPPGPPPPPPPPARDTPEPVVGSGPTLAAPAAEVMQYPRDVKKLEQAITDPKSLFWDPFAIVDALGYKDKPTPITYGTLKAMVQQMPIVQAIIVTRCKQVRKFAKVQQNKFATGFRISQRNKKAKATAGSESRSQELERWLLTTGTTNNPAGRDSFGAFLEKVTRDSMTYDQASWETVPARSGKPAEFYAVDGATIRIADTTRLYVDAEDMDVARYVQVYDGLVAAEYSSRELSMMIRNPVTDIRNQGYGQSELEMLIETITSLLWAMDYNRKFFSQGTSAKGIINFKGAVQEKQIAQFRQHWYTMTAGVVNAYKTPIVNSDDLQWINMQVSNRDMEYNAWMDFLIKIACAVYQMDPMEVNFKYGDTGQKSMFESANATKLASSKDKGLAPILDTLAEYLNSSLIHQLDEDFQLEFVGLDAQTPAEQADLNTKLVKSIKTVNEARAEEDMAPLPNGMGDVILDPVFMQHLAMAQQAQQQIDTANSAQDGKLPGVEGFGGDGGKDSTGENDEGGIPEVPPASEDDTEAEPVDDGLPDGVEKSLRAVRGRGKLQKAEQPIVIEVEV